MSTSRTVELSDATEGEDSELEITKIAQNDLDIDEPMEDSVENLSSSSHFDGASGTGRKRGWTRMRHTSSKGIKVDWTDNEDDLEPAHTSTGKSKATHGTRK